MNPREPDWSLYRSFLAVLEQGSLSGAARLLGLTQPTIARHIEALEQGLGLELFVRSQQGLSPTEGALELRGENFDIHVLIYPDMGPGGLLYRHHNTPHWSSFDSATARGLEQLSWPQHWAIGHGQRGGDDRPFRGAALSFQIAQTEAW